MDAELVNRLLSNPDGGIERVLVKPVDGIAFQGVAGIGRKDSNGSGKIGSLEYEQVNFSAFILNENSTINTGKQEQHKVL